MKKKSTIMPDWAKRAVGETSAYGALAAQTEAKAGKGPKTLVDWGVDEVDAEDADESARELAANVITFLSNDQEITKKRKELANLIYRKKADAVKDGRKAVKGFAKADIDSAIGELVNENSECDVVMLYLRDGGL